MERNDKAAIEALLKRHGFHFSKSMGQNFLIDSAIPYEIAESSRANEQNGVLEIGPGIGALSHELCERAGRVVSVELDKTLLPILEETMARFDNFEVVSADILKIMMLVALPCAAILLMLKKDFGKESDAPAREYTPQQEMTRAALIGLGLGCYDGLIGPGTGTFMIMAFTMALSMDLLTASGCAKIANLCSNVASAVLFIISGKVWWLLALPAAACNMLGAYCGARYAMKGGSKRVRGMIFVVLGLLFIKMGYELLF